MLCDFEVGMVHALWRVDPQSRMGLILFLNFGLQISMMSFSENSAVNLLQPRCLSTLTFWLMKFCLLMSIPHRMISWMMSGLTNYPSFTWKMPVKWWIYMIIIIIIIHRFLYCHKLVTSEACVCVCCCLADCRTARSVESLSQHAGPVVCVDRRPRSHATLCLQLAGRRVYTRPSSLAGTAESLPSSCCWLSGTDGCWPLAPVHCWS